MPVLPADLSSAFAAPPQRDDVGYLRDAEKEHVSDEIRSRLGTMLSTLYAVSVLSTKHSARERELKAAERGLLEAREQVMPGTPEYAGYCMSLDHIELSRQKLMHSNESLAHIETLIPLWDLKQTVEIERLKALRDALD
jgi:hypothetical protein